jgi:hypothetical protein
MPTNQSAAQPVASYFNDRESGHSLFGNTDKELVNWQIYRKKDRYTAQRTRLPMNPIFSHPLPLP